MLTDGCLTTDAGVTGIHLAHLGALGSGELKFMKCVQNKGAHLQCMNTHYAKFE